MDRSERTIVLRIREIADERGITLEKMHELTGVDNTTLSKLSKGRVPFRQWHIEFLCKGLGIEPCELFARNDSDRSRRMLEMFEALPDQEQEFVLSSLEGPYAQHKARTQPE